MVFSQTVRLYKVLGIEAVRRVPSALGVITQTYRTQATQATQAKTGLGLCLRLYLHLRHLHFHT